MRYFPSLIFCLLISSTSHAGSDRTKVDMIVYGDYLVTMDGKEDVIHDGAVAILGNTIVATGPSIEIDQGYKSKVKISGKDKILMPGLINGHGHAAMVLFRGMADDLNLMEWLSSYIFPMEGQFVNPEFISIGTELACWEMIRGGTTTYVDMYFYPDTIAETIVDCGMRAVIASPAIDFPSPGFKGWEDSFGAAVDYVTRWKGKHERITPAFAPHAPYTVSPFHIKEVAEKAKELDVPVSMHIAEAPSEVEDIQKRYGNTPVQHVADQGLLDVTLIAAHMVQPNAEEIAMLSGKQIGAIHNPTSNLKLAAGIAPVAQMLKAGVLVGLGTDGAASNNDLDMWEELHLAALIHKNQNQDPTAMPAMTALKLATSMGAAAIGLGDITGTLEAGKRADMIQINVATPGLTPMYNVISQLVYAVDSDDVVTSIVSGKVLMKEGIVLTLNADDVRQNALAKANEISKALANQD
ncbi:MAG: 5-methylthioadenosine/S-adenosylhomocysteine deaminase [Candidatus Azotimanducaceae bacterium]|jgi:5-methylthioadenosine/S-adenosylhomocysteine deaminase